ncbi:MAG: PilN domain-containing protein [candidate division Zixibacteria bacterium]|nr:PilN domain-containing protein [Candidatus Tariuqbacter arcticus]
MLDRFIINLNRGEGQEEKLARWHRRREAFMLYTFLCIFIVLTLFNYNNHRAMQGLIQIKEEKIERINRELEELQRQGQNVSKADVLALAQLEKNRFLWTKKFWSLAEILPRGVAVTGMEFNNEVYFIKFIARLKQGEKDFDRISELMELLRGTEGFYQDFMEIKFDESHRIVVEDQDILSFSVVCKLRKVVTTQRERGSRRQM